MMVYLDGADRFYAKESDLRRDGTRSDPETHRQGAAAESFAAEMFGRPFNRAVYSRGGDGGCDFQLTLNVEVRHLGFERDGSPRRGGNLIMHPTEPDRFADVYVVVAGSIESGFEVVGWTDHAELIRRPPRDFGYGLDYHVPVAQLRNIDSLKALCLSRSRNPAKGLTQWVAGREADGEIPG